MILHHKVRTVMRRNPSPWPMGTRSEASGDHQNKKNDDQDPDDADPAMSEAIAVSAEAAAEAPEQEDDEEDEKNGTKRHDCPLSVAGPCQSDEF